MYVVNPGVFDVLRYKCRVTFTYIVVKSGSIWRDVKFGCFVVEHWIFFSISALEKTLGIYFYLFFFKFRSIFKMRFAVSHELQISAAIFRTFLRRSKSINVVTLFSKERTPYIYTSTNLPTRSFIIFSCATLKTRVHNYVFILLVSSIYESGCSQDFHNL